MMGMCRVPKDFFLIVCNHRGCRCLKFNPAAVDIQPFCRLALPQQRLGLLLLPYSKA
jgi:hypothetical protein